MNKVTCPWGSSYTLPKCGFTARGEMVFTGWTIYGGGPTLDQPGGTILEYEDITLVANWAHKNDGDISFEAWVPSRYLPDYSGNFYLTRDIVYDESSPNPTGSEHAYVLRGRDKLVNLSLNGYSVKGTDYHAWGVISVSDGAELNIYDASNEGYIEDLENPDCVVVYANSKATLVSGVLRDRACMFGGTFNMVGG